jgi:hypothetical protein
MQKFIDHEGSITFGKYKGCTLSTLLADVQYVNWLVETANNLECVSAVSASPAPFVKFVKRYVVQPTCVSTTRTRKPANVNFNKLQDACSSAVSSQIGLMKQQHLGSEREVEYSPETPLTTMINLFLQAHPELVVPHKFDKLSDVFGVRRTCFQPVDHIFEQKWQAFHLKTAQYVLKNVNLKQQENVEKHV